LTLCILPYSMVLLFTVVGLYEYLKIEILIKHQNRLKLCTQNIKTEQVLKEHRFTLTEPASKKKISF